MHAILDNFVGRKKTIVGVKCSGRSMILRCLFLLGFNQSFLIVLDLEKLLISLPLVVRQTR